MKTKKLKDFKRRLEAWVIFNSKNPMNLIDISQLILIIKDYYVIYPKKAIRKTGKAEVKE